MNKIKESKKIFPCTIYMENQNYDEEYYYLDTPDYGLAWRSFDDVGPEDIENYNYIIKNITDLRTAIKSLKEDFLYGYGAKYFKLSKNYMEELLNKGETLVHVFNSNVSNEEDVFIIKVEPVQSLELTLAESFEKTIKSLQKEGLFENIKSFDLDFTGKGINIKLNEGYPGDRKDKPVVYTNDEANVIDRFDYKYLEKVIKSLGGTKEFTHRKSETEKPHDTKVYYIGGRSDDHKQLFSDNIISYWTIPLTIKDIKLHIEVAVGYDKYNRLSALVGIDNYHGLIQSSIKRILTSIGFEPAISTKSISDEYSDTFGKHYSVSYDKSFTDTAPINALFKSGSIAKVANILRDLKQKLKLINRNWNNNFVKNEEEYYAQKGLIPGQNEYKVLIDSDNNTIITSEGDSLIKEDLHIFLKDLQKDNKNKNIDWEYLFDWLKD